MDLSTRRAAHAVDGERDLVADDPEERLVPVVEVQRVAAFHREDASSAPNPATRTMCRRWATVGFTAGRERPYRPARRTTVTLTGRNAVGRGRPWREWWPILAVAFPPGACA